MISAYKIGIEIALTGNIGRVISDLTKQFDAVNAAVKRVQESITKLAHLIQRVEA
jgi:prefoldin subunit 5